MFVNGVKWYMCINLDPKVLNQDAYMHLIKFMLIIEIT